MSATPRTSREDQHLTILQLDTRFPRIPGDVASPDTYLQPVQVNKIPQASVDRIVTAHPDQYDISSLEQICAKITQGIAVSSCGFLGYWQDHLAAHCKRPLITSALIDLPRCQSLHTPDEIAIVTFNADILQSPLYQPMLAGFAGPIIGLKPDMHLRKVISEDSTALDIQRAEDEMLHLLTPILSSGKIKALVLECTNLPPYKNAIKTAFNIQIYDILTSLDARIPHMVKPEFL